MSIRIALAGNPNCGKTTLFNALTGSRQTVGNWPGVTVEKKEGHLRGYPDVEVVDLPGIYSLSPYSPEEVVARTYLVEEKPEVILNIVDGTNLERNLYLTTQLIELGLPTVVAINMLDLLQKSGDVLDTGTLSAKLGCPVVAISALEKTGIDEAVGLALQTSGVPPKGLRHHYSGALEHALAHIEEAVLHDEPENIQHWYAIRLFERDSKIAEKLGLTSEQVDHIEKDIVACEEELDNDSESIMSFERYEWVGRLVSSSLHAAPRQLSISDKIDQIVTNRFLALPIFILVITGVYYLAMHSLGAFITDWVNDVFFGKMVPDAVSGWLEALEVDEWLSNLILDGIVAGVGAVLGFVPQIFLLFAMLGIVESCGYMARVAFILDQVFHRIGLSGKSFIPILIGTGCGVPGIMASRTIENEADRRMTVITTTFIPCSAKLPIIAMFAGAIFHEAWWVAPAAYFTGIAAIVISGVILKKTRLFASDPAPFVMELPPYRWPRAGALFRSTWERGFSFIKKAGTIILLSTILIWFVSSYGWSEGGLGMVENMEDSLLASVGNAVKYLFVPLGWGDWKAVVATITGLIAKENLVGTFGVLYGVGEVEETGKEIWAQLGASYTGLSAWSILVFNLLCAPCFAAMGAIRREMENWKWFLFAIGYQSVFAWCVALCFYQLGMWVTAGVFGIWTAIALALVALGVYMLFRKGYTVRIENMVNGENAVG
jgi:ferrous iron transport protein B